MSDNQRKQKGNEPNEGRENYSTSDFIEVGWHPTFAYTVLSELGGRTAYPNEALVAFGEFGLAFCFIVHFCGFNTNDYSWAMGCLFFMELYHSVKREPVPRMVATDV
jgi:hypothetical protein